MKHPEFKSEYDPSALSAEQLCKDVLENATNITRTTADIQKKFDSFVQLKLNNPRKALELASEIVIDCKDVLETNTFLTSAMNELMRMAQSKPKYVIPKAVSDTFLYVPDDVNKINHWILIVKDDVQRMMSKAKR